MPPNLTSFFSLEQSVPIASPPVFSACACVHVCMCTHIVSNGTRHGRGPLSQRILQVLTFAKRGAFRILFGLSSHQDIQASSYSLRYYTGSVGTREKVSGTFASETRLTDLQSVVAVDRTRVDGTVDFAYFFLFFLFLHLLLLRRSQLNIQHWLEGTLASASLLTGWERKKTKTPSSL